jgi:uncharacterized protein
LFNVILSIMINNYITYAVKLLDKLLTDNKIPEHHGLSHAMTVMQHVQGAIKCDKKVPEQDQLIILLTALLHDADDPKIFKTNNNENARAILSQLKLDHQTTTLIIKLINSISVSKNGDSIPEEAIPRSWLLWPRYADRLEAIGLIGIKRCLQVTVEFGNPLYTDDTPKAVDKEGLAKIATEERYKNYKKSVSMIDHYYDKLLHIGKFVADNDYLDGVLKERQEIMQEVCFAYGRGELELFLEKLK